jgi:TetR/AcrR family transcriptional repressor of lmrAB and yxaGH operons
MLHTAAGLFQRQGYAGTGLKQLLDESGAPKGSLYFHFPEGKEQLAAESVALAGAELGSRMAEALAAAPGAGEGVMALAGLLARDLQDSGYRDGCPVATVALDAASDSEPIRGACAGTYEAWQSGLAAFLTGHGVDGREAEGLAGLVLSALQGGLLLARVRRDADVVREVGARMAGVVAPAARGRA